MNADEYYRPTQHASAQDMWSLPALIRAIRYGFKVQLSVQLLSTYFYNVQKLNK